MKTIAQGSKDGHQGPDLPSRRRFIGGTAAAVAITAGLGEGLLDNAQAAESGSTSPIGGRLIKVTADGKIVTSFNYKPKVTAMFTTVNVQIGPEGVLPRGATNLYDLCPYMALALVQPGMRYTPHMHDGYSLGISLPLKPSPGERREPLDIRFNGMRPTRKPNNGGVSEGGAREFAFYPNAYAGAPQFVDREDPLVKSVYKAMPDGGAAWRSLPPLAPWKSPPTQTPHPLNRTKQARTVNDVKSYLCQIGPLAWDAEYDYYDPHAYVTLMDFGPNAAMPANWHNGYSGVAVIDGTMNIPGMALTEGSFVLYEPKARYDLKAGPKGSTIVAYFDSGRAAFPVWDNPSDSKAVAFNEGLRVPS